MKVLEKIKHFFGLEQKSEYIQNSIEKANIQSSLYLSSTIIIFELWMILSITFTQIFGETKRSAKWLLMHLPFYFLLIISASIVFVHAIRTLKGKKKPVFFSRFIHTFFSIVCIGFGIYISYLDYIKGEQFVTLITMSIYIFCFLVWPPTYSFIFLTLTYSVFFIICDYTMPATYATKINLFIVWSSVLLAAISNYHRVFLAAEKDEKLEEANDILVKLSISDEITGSYNMNYFVSQTLVLLHDDSVDISKKIFLFLDIEHFKNYNEKYGFLEGNEFLRKVGQCVKETFGNSIVAHISNDNFVVFADDADVESKLEVIRKTVVAEDKDISLGLKAGGYKTLDREVLPIIACDHARYACYSIKKLYGTNYVIYSSQMNDDYYRKKYIINNIDKAVEKHYIKVYYQPLIDAKTGALCGLEALARWDDPEYGFLMPSVFIETLEEYHQIHKLDMFVLDQVCRDILDVEKNYNFIIPVSINFSRLDFDAFDLSKQVETKLAHYNINKKYIHLEITESALVSNDSKMKNFVTSLHSSGYKLWLDDFGSGYSGLNVLKEYDFDVMKIDMKFLENFSNNPKSKIILKNIVSLAKDVGLSTLTEGVESEDASDYLKEIGCDKLQGYLFGKPMPKAELLRKIEAGIYTLEPAVK